jgi:hypothetical protein
VLAVVRHLLQHLLHLTLQVEQQHSTLLHHLTLHFTSIQADQRRSSLIHLSLLQQRLLQRLVVLQHSLQHWLVQPIEQQIHLEVQQLYFRQLQHLLPLSSLIHLEQQIQAD